MAIKKSDLYSSLWASCDELRGGMDASQYKDYVLTMLFVKYVSDKYAGKNDLIVVPEGASFEDMIALKGKDSIGDDINKKILRPLFAANGLEGSMELVDFNDDDKLGSGQEKIDRLSKLIAIFENPALNFKNNRAEDDDILGDAYEYLMRHFATESGKSKGQFYTPAEVSRILAKVLDVDKADVPSYTAYDPTCGSGSLLLKVAEEAPNGLTIYGQEKDIATKGLAIMNMWLHGYPEATIYGKNTLANPQTTDEDGNLKRFDFVVANPPFSLKNWSNGIAPLQDEYKRFQGYGVPPEKNGDYAFLLHILASLKSTGKGAVILPHGVLFRGNAEAGIRQNIIERKWIKGIIGLPANLFYGTGIPACILVIDKEHSESRTGIFMIDASKGFIKDGNKNRLREQDLHKIVDVFNNQWELAKYSRLVPFEEIEKNEYNLNIPRYIDTQEDEDIQDLNAHLNGGIPQKDIDDLQAYWEVYPNLRKELFTPIREGYSKLNVAKGDIKETIFNHPDFLSYNTQLDTLFAEFKEANLPEMNAIDEDTKPKAFIKQIAEDLLQRYANKPLIGRYEVYQHLMNYWGATLKDDVYMLVEEGWVAKVQRIIEKNNRGKEVDKGWTCELIPKALVINTYLAEEQQALEALQGELETTQAERSSLEEEHSGDDGAFGSLDKINKAEVTRVSKELKAEAQPQQTAMAAEPDAAYGDKLVTDLQVAKKWLKLYTKEANLKKDIKAAEAELDKNTLAQYGKLTEAEVRKLVVEDKWLASLYADMQTEIDGISQRLANRIKELAARYEHTLNELDTETLDLENKVTAHLEKMGLVWN
ncbi:type I restriction-modification system subunit M [Leeuwenhoekiella marinoflava]|uniref:site-specific DNA-methyltransferase (adenine-specific) n=2 Tax=Leeuwenhoekiella marinoflava TaxID=988 RepID=A0A4Q0PLF1_9FLAO|nr:type I restriction-modification system subunit M [Leeuwenhoekiella marinoflava]RXG29881.1 type I restriction enzyme M protein [Leeuwenhoekiella marinoflava]SHF27449.1 type I restriction enzyme M protein [Leeuwenhoekiella marinoflava DSM 3653]